MNKEIKNGDALSKRMETQMLGKLQLYWSGHGEVLAAAIVFDPCYKFQFVAYCYKNFYGCDSNVGSSPCMCIREKLFSPFDGVAYSGFSNSTAHILDHTTNMPRRRGRA